MNNWTAGYVSDIGYTFGYYNEVNPLRAKLAFLNAGYAPPVDSGCHCELGFGQGISINIHAAASGSLWYGTDFNPSQAAFAQSLATASGANLHLTDLDFLSFTNLKNLPDFDSISLHGIWSWISDENRTVIVNFIKSKLKVGGFLYISYNTLPGWSNFAPIRHLLFQHASIIGSEGQGTASRVSQSLNFTQDFLELSSHYSSNNPQVISKFSQIKNQDVHYLAHEYFNKDWQPMYFSDVANMLGAAKLSYICSGNYLDHIDAINLTNEQLNYLNSIKDVYFKQTVLDFIVNRQFRRDYWIKGPINISVSEREKGIKDLSVILITNKNDISFLIKGILGEASLNSTVYNPLIEELSNHESTSIDYLTTRLHKHNILFNQILEAIMILIGAGHVALVQNSERTISSIKFTDQLNSFIIKKNYFDNNLNYLASPITGGGVHVSKFELMFLNAILNGKSLPSEWATFVFNSLSVQNQKLIKDGVALESEEEIFNELTKQANDFSTKRLPLLISLKTVNF